MEILPLANVLEELFDAQAVVGLVLFGLVIYAIFHGLRVARHGGGHPHDGDRR